jgi:shikimate dehydrogenase
VSGTATRLAVLGHPLDYTLSPELHRAGIRSTVGSGESEAIPTTPDELPERLKRLSARGFLGVNLTRPLKEPVLPLLARVSAEAAAARSVNTVGLGPDGWWGDTTDGPGFVDLLATLGRRPARQRVVLLGAGAAARSLGLALLAGDADVVVSARRPGDVWEAWAGMPEARFVAWRSGEEEDALAEATVVVNATPLGGADEPAPLETIRSTALLVDLSYGAAVGGWVWRARAHGREAYDGLGLLVFQARRSLALWLARPVAVDPLARAVGWPR